MSNLTRLVTIGLALTMLVMLSGCIKIGLDMAVAPDGSTSGKFVVGMDKNLDQMGESTGNPFSELAQGPDAKRWKVREYAEGNWKMTEAVGSAAPGDPLFSGDEAPKLQVQTSQRRLTTRTTLTLQPPAFPDEMVSPQAAEGQEDMTQLVGAMMASMEVKFALTGPGKVLATTGTVAGPGRAEWKLGFKDLQSKQIPDFKLTTELINWTNVGRLADQIMADGKRYDAGMRLAEAVERNLLPNPPANVTASEKLGAADYALLLDIIARLDAELCPAVTVNVLQKARLASDGVTSAQVRTAHSRLMKADLGALVDSSATAAAVQVLTGK